MRKIFTRRSVALEADISQLSVTQALDKELNDQQQKNETPVVTQNEEESNPSDVDGGTTDTPDGASVDNPGSEDQADAGSDSTGSGEPVESESINADVEEGLDDEFISEAMALSTAGQQVSQNYNYEAYKAFKTRSTALINSMNTKLGMESIVEDYAIDSEELAQEDIASTLKSIAQKIIEYIRSAISFISGYANLIKSDVATFNKRQDDLQESLDMLKTNNAKTLDNVNYGILLIAKAEPSANAFMQGNKVMNSLLDSYFTHFKMNFPQFSTSVGKMVEDFTNLRSTTATIHLKAETRPSVLRSVKQVPALKAPNENMTAWASNDFTDDVFLGAWIGKDQVVNLGEPNSIFDSSIVLTRGFTGAGDGGDSGSTSREYPAMTIEQLKSFLSMLRATTSKYAYGETSLAVCSEDLRKFERKIEYFSKIKIDDNEENADLMKKKVSDINTVLTGVVGVYKRFYITPTKGVCSYAKHYISSGLNYIGACIKKHDKAAG